MRLLVMCVANSARSQMAEGWVRALSDNTVVVDSAGSEPTRPRPEAIQVMAEVGIDLGGHTSKLASELPTPDVVATLCAEEVCPAYPGDVERLSWATEDPATDHGSEAERVQRFRVARDLIRGRVSQFLEQRGLARRFGRTTRPLFALQDGITFLNHGSFGATPREVLAAQQRIIQELEDQPVRFMIRRPERVRELAGRLAGFLGARAEDMVLIDNASSGISAVLRSLELGPADVLVTTTHAYHAVSKALAYVARRSGARLVHIPLPFPVQDPEQIVAAVEAAWPEGARLACFDHITSATGLRLPVERLVALAHDRGARVLVDGAHVPGHIPVHLASLGADYWVGNVHKWLFAPKGCAALYARTEFQPDLHPLVISHGHGDGFAAGFEGQGTRDPSPWLALGSALDFAASHRPDAIRAHNIGLRQEGGQLLAQALQVAPPAPDTMLAALQTLPLPTTRSGTIVEAHALNTLLWEQHRVEAMIVPFDGRLWVRISAQIYNEPDDYRHLAAALHDTL